MIKKKKKKGGGGERKKQPYFEIFTFVAEITEMK